MSTHADIVDVALARGLARSDDQLRALVEHAHLGLVVHRFGPIAYASESVGEVLGLGADELVGRDVASLFLDPVLAEDAPFMARLAGARGRTASAEVRALAIDYEGAPAILLLLRDTSSEARLLRELNHRIKNNLQIICSLLSLQSQHVGDPATREAFAESQRRVQAIAFVHDQLHQSQDLARVNLGAYLHQVVGGLARTLDAAARGIGIELEAGTVELAIDVAIPCGLLVNELVTNALRHAFPGRSGTITIRLHERDRRVTLEVADDGVGLPDELAPGTAKTLGLALVATFAEQLEATMRLSRDRGTTFSFAFAIAQPNHTR